MDLATKYQIIEKIVQLQDDAILEEIKALLETASGNWWNEISQAERDSIERGLEQADRGEVIPHEQAWSQIMANRKKRA